MKSPAAPLRFSVLDQAPISEGSTGAEALHHSLQLARLADKAGYHRYWVSEHHGTPALACASPETLIPAIASVTSRLRVGSGGIMLPHYSPLKVAENFSMLSGLFPGRIDLGVGRAPGSDPGTAFALQRDKRQRAPDDFMEQLAELHGYLDDSLPAGHPFKRLAALPGRPERPIVWLLGSSMQSAIWAGELGMPYVFADFINPAGAQLVEIYRERFVPSAWLGQPRVIAAVSAIAAETAAEAQRLATSWRMLITLLQRGQLIPVPPVERAEAFLRGEHGLADPGALGRRLVFGPPEHVVAGLESAARDYGAEEIMVVTITHAHDARKRSYELIAEAAVKRGHLMPAEGSVATTYR